jgi:hypothetical protein
LGDLFVQRFIIKNKLGQFMSQSLICGFEDKNELEAMIVDSHRNFLVAKFNSFYLQQNDNEEIIEVFDKNKVTEKYQLVTLISHNGINHFLMYFKQDWITYSVDPIDEVVHIVRCADITRCESNILIYMNMNFKEKITCGSKFKKFHEENKKIQMKQENPQLYLSPLYVKYYDLALITKENAQQIFVFLKDENLLKKDFKEISEFFKSKVDFFSFLFKFS